MKKLMRNLLGVTLLAGLLAVAAVALPRGLEDLMFWIGVQETAEVYAGLDVMAEAEPKTSARPSGNPPGWERRDDRSRPPRASRTLLGVNHVVLPDHNGSGDPDNDHSAEVLNFNGNTVNHDNNHQAGDWDRAIGRDDYRRRLSVHRYRDRGTPGRHQPPG